MIQVAEKSKNTNKSLNDKGMESNIITLKSGKQLRQEPQKESHRDVLDQACNREKGDEKVDKSSRLDGSSIEGVIYDVVSHLKRILARLSIYDALKLSKSFRQDLIQAFNQ